VTVGRAAGDVWEKNIRLSYEPVCVCVVRGSRPFSFGVNLRWRAYPSGK